MQIACGKTELVNAINIAMKAVPPRSTMPILECLVISTDKGRIHFIANDTEMGIDTVVDGKVEEEGSIAVSGKLFSDIVKKLPEDEVYVSSDERYMVSVDCGKAHFTFGGQPTDEYTFPPTVEREDCVVLSQHALKNAITKTIFSLSQNDSGNRLLTGEHFYAKGMTLKATALDGHRIAIRRVELSEEAQLSSAIIPGKTLLEISRIISGEMDDSIELYFTDRHIIFAMEDTTVVSSLIDGRYFDVDQMISDDYSVKVIANRQGLIECIDRATLFVRENDRKPIILEFTDEGLSISIESQMGRMHEELDVMKEGNDIRIGFNPRLLLDALKAVDEENVTLYMTNDKGPCYIRDEEGMYNYLVLPINTGT